LNELGRNPCAFPTHGQTNIRDELGFYGTDDYEAREQLKY